MSDALSLPVDAGSAAALAERGLRIAVIDPADDALVRAWVGAVARGFHEGEPTDELLAEVRGDFSLQRSVGVYDDTLDDPAVPAGTIVSWPAPLSLPGGEVDGWAISGVTVAPTHRRRGIGRAMLEAELRTAVVAGLPVAMLTVSEATIYTRYGFGPAAWTTDFEIDARLAGWTGEATPGRVQLVGRDAALATAGTLLEEARRATPGDVGIVGHRLGELFGSPSDPAEQRKHRIARYDDADGVPRGLVSYRLVPNPTDFTQHTAVISHLATTTDDAYRALWRYLLELDLVSVVKASLRSLDEPLRWLVRDPRTIRTTEVREHLWVRVLDPRAAFGARSYGGPGRLTLRSADPLGHADGAFVIDVDAAGLAVVEPGESEEGPLLDLPVDLLGSLLLGGASAVTLAAAGRLRERTLGDAATADRLLRSPRPPVLTTWF